MRESGKGTLNGIEKCNDERVDIHCHCLPAVDDGPTTMQEAVMLCQGLVDDGLTTVIATPHQLGRFTDCNESEQIRESVELLNEELEKNEISLTVMPGGDVRVDERICQLLESDKILTLGDGGRYILLELPHQVFIDIEPLLVELNDMGVQAIISHPERHLLLIKQSQVILKWINLSASLQITAGSLLGEFGKLSQKAAWRLLIAGQVSIVATDSHGLDSRRPCMKAAYEEISNKLGEKTAQLVCVENPLRVLKSQDIVQLTPSELVVR